MKPHNRPARLRAGYTLIELIATLAIATIVLGIGMPTVGYFSASNSLTATVNDFVGGYRIARSNAIRQNENTVVCSSHDLDSCSNSNDWGAGLIVFADLNRDRQRNPDEPIIHSKAINPDNLEIISSTRRYKTVYQPTGTASGTNLTIRFCPHDTDIKPRAIVVSNVGRVRLSGKQIDGTAVECPD